MTILDTSARPVGGGKRTGATMAILSGGGGKPFAHACPADVTIYVDAENETEGVEKRPGLFKVELGGQDTALSLAARNSGHALADLLHRKYSAGPNVHLAKGLAQDPLLAKLAAEDYVRSGRLEPVIRQVMQKLFEATNGDLRSVQLWEVNGNSGGTGPGVAPAFAAVLVEAFQRETSAIIHHRQFRFGAMSYMSVADRALENAANSTDQDMKRIEEKRAVQLLPEAVYVELPLRNQLGDVVLGGDQETRDALIGLICQARMSRQLTEVFDSREVNQRNLSKFGANTRIRARWSRAVKLDEIAEDGARQYNEVARGRVAYSLPEFALPAATVTPSFESANPVSTDEVINELRIYQGRNGPKTTLLMSEDVPQGKARLEISYGGRSSSVGELSAQIAAGQISSQDVALVGRDLTNFSSEIEAGLASKKNARDVSRRSLASRMVADKGGLASWSAKIRGALRSGIERREDEKQIKALISQTVEARNAYAGAHATLRAADEAVAVLSAASRSTLTDVSEGLGALHRANDGSREPLAYFAPFEEALPALRHVIAAGRGLNLLKLELLRQVRAVSMAAVGRMFDTAADATSIAEAIRRDVFEWESPMWGGAPSTDKPRYQFIVMPPMVRKDFDDIETAMRRHTPDLQLVSADMVMGGCAVVGLDFYPVLKKEDLMPPLYNSRLKIERAA